MEVASSKEGKRKADGQPEAGQAKGAEPPGTETGARQGEGTGQHAGTSASKTPGQADPKQDGGKGRMKEATPEDVARLKDQVRAADPQERQKALEDLAELQQQAKDPNVRDLAKQALEETKGQQTGSAEPSKGNGSVDTNVKGNGNGQGTPDKAAAPPQGGNAQLGSKKGGDGPKGKIKGPNGTNGPRQAGPEDDPKANKADPRFAKRGGDLQLDELKKKLTPELLKKLKPNWTEQEQQEFLRYLRQGGSRPQDKRASNPLLPGLRQQAGAGPEPLPGRLRHQPVRQPAGLRPLPAPPEFRDAHRRFTSGGAGRGVALGGNVRRYCRSQGQWFLKPQGESSSPGGCGAPDPQGSKTRPGA